MFRKLLILKHCSYRLVENRYWSSWTKIFECSLGFDDIEVI